MNSFPLLAARAAALSLAAWIAAAGSARAGHEIVSKEVAKEEAPIRTWFPDFPPGYITVGSLFSEHNTGVYLDSITGLWSPKTRDAFLFLNSRYHYEDNGQFISSLGAGYRQMFGGQVIIGGNAYWDSIGSAQGNDFAQLGLGLEILTKWIDARVNYYLPDNDRYEVSRSTRRDRSEALNGNGDLIGTARTRHFKTYEAGLEGFNAELGFLVPGVDRYAEVRIFGGLYHYDNPFGSDYEGFKARLEARLLPGIIADLEYWDDAALMGGHWTAGLRASVPFSIYNLVKGRNPFEGIGEQFVFRQRAFSERLGDMVIRSHRIQTATSGPIAAGGGTSSEVLSRPEPPARRAGDDGFPLE